MTTNTTHFGFKQVASEDKVKLVRGVFDSVAGQYDIMNDLMSMGIHRIWKRVAVQLSNVRKGEQVLDLAGGTGDLTTLFEKRVEMPSFHNSYCTHLITIWAFYL